MSRESPSCLPAGGRDAAPVPWLLAAVLGIYVVLTAAFIWRTPPGSAPDERAHLAYVEHLATKHALPIFDAGLQGYEAHQPPLYYALAAPAYWLAAGHGQAAAMYAVRVVSALIGAGVIYVLFLVGRCVFPDVGSAQVATAAVGAFVPMHVALFAAVSNDGLLVLFATLVLYLSLRAVGEGLSPGRAALLGVVLGLGLLTKTAILPFAAVALVAVVVGMRRAEGLVWVVVGKRLGLLVGAAVLLSGWWLVRNVALYGDPLALGRFVEAFSRSAHPPSYFGEYGLLSAWQFRLLFVLLTHFGFWGIFGNLEEYMPWWFYGLGAGLALLAVFGLVGLRRAAWRPRGEHLLLLALAAALVVASYLGFNMRFFQAQARYLFPAMGAYACFAVMGWRALLGERWGNVLVVVALAAMVLMSLGVLWPDLRVPHEEFWEI